MHGRDGGARGAPIGFEPGPPLTGVLRAPGSKSLAQRYILAASLAHGSTRLGGLPAGDDVAATLALVRAAGVQVDAAGGPGAVRIAGRPPGGLASGWLAVDVRERGAPAPPIREHGEHAEHGEHGQYNAGESGTLARFASALLALCARPGAVARLGGAGTLLARRSPALFRALSDAGAGVAFEGLPGGWPVRLTAIGPPSWLDLVDPTSSQEASALALALAAYPGQSTLRITGELPSAPYFSMTLAVLERFGAVVREPRAPDPGTARTLKIALKGPLEAPRDPLTVEPDASSAAIALVAACISGGEVRASGFSAGGAARPLQGDVRIVDHLAAFGCAARMEAGMLIAGGTPRRPAELDLRGEPDLAPPLAALAAARALVAPAGERPTRLFGLHTLPGKESSRIEVLARGIAALGLHVHTTSASLEIGPAQGAADRVDRVDLDAAGDHRMVFAFALLGLARRGIRVVDSAPIAKSWGTFFHDLERLGAHVARRDGV